MGDESAVVGDLRAGTPGRLPMGTGVVPAGSQVVGQPFRQQRTNERSGVARSDHASAISRPSAKPRLVPKRTIETASAELEDGTQIELIEDPGDPSRSQLAVFRNSGVQIVERFEFQDRMFVPIPRDTNVVRHVRLPRGIKSCGTAQSLLRDTIEVLSRCVDLRGDYVALLAQFIFSTWLIERLPVAPYVALVGLPRAGKSTALTALSLLCRRGLLTADITSAAFYRVCDRLTPTLLIDETGSAAERKSLFHLLRTGTTREVVALRKDQSFRTFGPKVISWIELPSDAALNSRCIVIPLHETFRTDLLRPTSPEFRHDAEDLQKRFLQFRFENLKSLIRPRVELFNDLHSRSRDLFEALALPVGEDEEICRWLAGKLKEQDDSHRAPLSAKQSAALQALFWFIHQLRKNGASIVADLANLTNACLRAAGENVEVTPREAGAIMTALGFTNRRRTNKGWTLNICSKEVKQVHALVTAYGVPFPHQLSESDCRNSCEYCKQIDAPQQL